MKQFHLTLKVSFEREAPQSPISVPSSLLLDGLGQRPLVSPVAIALEFGHGLFIHLDHIMTLVVLSDCDNQVPNSYCGYLCS